MINPDRGWIVNWNNKPAHGWLDGGGQSETSYPAGIDARVATLADVVERRDDWTFDDLVELDGQASSLDFRARHFLSMILELRGAAGLSDVETEVLELLAAWDGSANGPGADMEFAGYGAGEDNATVGAAPTVFHRMMDVLVADLFGFMRDPRYGESDAEWTFDLVGRQLVMGRHLYDMSPRCTWRCAPSIPRSRRWMWRMTTPEAGRPGRCCTTFSARRSRSCRRSSAMTTTWRSVYVSRVGGTNYGEVCNPTGVIGPCGHMPFTGGGAAVAALLALGGALARSRRRAGDHGPSGSGRSAR